MSEDSELTKKLVSLKPQHDFFVGIDSDGCVYDAMEIKQKECFCPNTIRVWELQRISKYAREAVEFVNLYSKWRGINRWPALIKVFELLKDRPEVLRRKAQIPSGNDIREFISSGLPTSDFGLLKYMETHSSRELDQAWEWTTSVNETIKNIVHGLMPFPFSKESMEALQNDADVFCVSATPSEALEREWRSGGIDHLVRMICGQEIGTKEDILRHGAFGKYAPDHVLMMGDAPGDLKAARAVNALFFPINPGHEEESWERFYSEGYKKFLDGTFSGSYETMLIDEFEKLLPEVPPWNLKHHDETGSQHSFRLDR